MPDAPEAPEAPEELAPLAPELSDEPLVSESLFFDFVREALSFFLVLLLVVVSASSEDPEDVDAPDMLLPDDPDEPLMPLLPDELGESVMPVLPDEPGEPDVLPAPELWATAILEPSAETRTAIKSFFIG